MENLPSPALVAAAEHHAAIFADAEIFYNQNGAEAFIVSGGASSSYIVAVTEDGHTNSATTGEWETGYDA